VQTVVNSGTVATPVRVTARIATPDISTQSNLLTISTGLPDTDSFSLALAPCPNVEAFNVDGVVVNVTARLSDRFNNPVPNGTAVNFKAEGGQIVAQCATGIKTEPSDPDPPAGSCTVKWTSSDPRPMLPSPAGVGRVSLLATAIGEDSFVDTNGNGFFDTGETYADLGEPYMDNNENDAYDSGEYFLDFNTDGSRNATDGAFSGITCTGITPGSTCGLTTTAIGSRAVIVMSTSGALVSNPTANGGGATVAGNGAVSMLHGNTTTLTFRITDLNGNAPPSGTKIDTTPTGVSLSGQTSVLVPCDGSRDGTPVVVTMTAAAATTGSITVKVTSPKGLETSVVFPVTIT
jgi:hypothetical protein